MTEEAIMYIIGLALLAVTCLIAFFYSRSTDRFDWWRLAEVSVSFLTLIAVVVYAGINYNQWTETRRLAETATRQLEMTDRPWLAARVVVTQPLKPGIDNISLIFVVV